MPDSYTEFPTDRIVDCHFPRKDDGGGGGGEPPTHPCGGDAYSISGTFPVSDSAPWSLVGGVRGYDTSLPDFPSGVRISGVVTIVGGTGDGHVVYPGLGPPDISSRPAYTNHGCGFDIGISEDGASYAVIGSTNDTDVAEGEGGGPWSGSAAFGPAAPGGTIFVAVRAHGGEMESNVHYLLLFVGGGYLGVGVNVDYTCTGAAVAGRHEHQPFIPDDQLPDGMRRVA